MLYRHLHFALQIPAVVIDMLKGAGAADVCLHIFDGKKCRILVSFTIIFNTGVLTFELAWPLVLLNKLPSEEIYIPLGCGKQPFVGRELLHHVFQIANRLSLSYCNGNTVFDALYYTIPASIGFPEFHQAVPHMLLNCKSVSLANTPVAVDLRIPRLAYARHRH